MTRGPKAAPRTDDFLEALEANIVSLEEDLLRGPLKDAPATEGSRRVRFGERVRKRAFHKDEPAVRHDGEEEEDEASYLNKVVLEDDDDTEDEEDDQSDELDELDFDALSPAEQLRLLMEPVEDEEDVDDEEDGDEDEDEDEEYGEDEEDEEDGDEMEFDVDSGAEDEEAHNVDGDREPANTGKRAKRLRLALGDDDEDEGDAASAVKSTFEKQQERLRRVIGALEEENVSEKPWMLRGEVTAAARPMNSLLEHDIDFEHASVAAPAITPEVTSSIEALIKQRIRDRAWDDVERKLPHEATQRQQPRKLPELATEKSGKSLSQVYEEELTTATAPAGRHEVDEETKKVHQEITQLFSKLCHKLDSLSNFKFNPRAYPLAEIQLKTNKKPAAAGVAPPSMTRPK